MRPLTVKVLYARTTGFRYSSGMSFVYALEMLGTAALAAVGMASFANFMAVAFIMGLSAGVQAIAARRLGEGRRDETASGLNSGLLIALLVGVPWSVLLIVFADRLFPFLIDDPEVVALGVPGSSCAAIAPHAGGILTRSTGATISVPSSVRGSSGSEPGARVALVQYS